METLVFCEVLDHVTEEMRSDEKVTIISDGAIFLVTTEAHSFNYPDFEWETVPEEAINAYNL